MKILVVDDDRRIVRTTCDILNLKGGHEAIAAYSGEEGVEQVRSHPPDCVLMDIKMPGISGVEALKRMKQIVPALPVVLISAYTTDDLLEEAERAGAYAVLGKPLDFSVILSFLSLLRKEENILVVGDDPELCRSLTDILTVRGFHAETESDPRRVMGRLERNYWLAIVIDPNLAAPGCIDDVMKDIQARYPGKPVVLMSGYHEGIASPVEQARRIGAYACLYKPYETDDLFKTIEEIRIMKLRKALVPVQAEKP